MVLSPGFVIAQSSPILSESQFPYQKNGDNTGILS